MSRRSICNHAAFFFFFQMHLYLPIAGMFFPSIADVHVFFKCQNSIKTQLQENTSGKILRAHFRNGSALVFRSPLQPCLCFALAKQPGWLRGAQGHIGMNFILGGDGWTRRQKAAFQSNHPMCKTQACKSTSPSTVLTQRELFYAPTGTAESRTPP